MENNINNENNNENNIKNNKDVISIVQQKIIMKV